MKFNRAFTLHKLSNLDAIIQGNNKSLYSSLSSSITHLEAQPQTSLETLNNDPQLNFSSPTLIKNTLFEYRNKPIELLKLIDNLGTAHFDLNCFCLAVSILSSLNSPQHAIQLMKKGIEKGYVKSNNEVFKEFESLEMSNTTTLVYDILISTYCKLKKAEEGLECFYFMMDRNVVPKIETCNELLSLLSKQNKTQMVWVLYAEMYKLKMKSTVVTFNVMINVLCKEGKMKKAKVFMGFMEDLGFKPNAITYNTIIHRYCLNGKLESAQEMVGCMKQKGVKLDSYTFGSIISALCKLGRLEEAVALFEKMSQNKLVPSAVTYNTLIDASVLQQREFGYSIQVQR
ncbi:hypothetical protein IFM89_027295 [Coptis chinensis]|uniref:Pentatricopeptide repeat-containing protein n=1 Tax=Coptis chinensis TaxID=261450 RepID=A0A835IG55_9MAGN|nr:hypothetical protein IFM89_027295 [Coptis chinensis]